MRSVFFSFVFLAAFALPAQADEIMVCGSNKTAFPATKLTCTLDEAKGKGIQTNLKALYKEGWKIITVVPVPLSSSMVIYLSRD